MGYLLATEKGLFSGTSDKAGARKQLAVVSANSSRLYHSVLLFPPSLSSEQRLSGRGRLVRAAQPPQNRLFPHPHDLVRTASQALAAPLSLSGNAWRKLSYFPHSAERALRAFWSVHCQPVSSHHLKWDRAKFTAAKAFAWIQNTECLRGRLKRPGQISKEAAPREDGPFPLVENTLSGWEIITLVNKFYLQLFSLKTGCLFFPRGQMCTFVSKVT